MADDNSKSRSGERQKLIAVVITLFALAFIAVQVGDVIEALEGQGTPQLILRALAVGVAVAVIVWAWLRFREKVKSKR